MNTLAEQEQNVENLITQNLNDLNLERASMALDNLIFTDYVLSRKPENISPAVKLYMELKYRKEFAQDKFDIKVISSEVNRNIKNGSFNMRFHYPGTRDLVELDEKYEAYSKYLEDEGVLIPGMDSHVSYMLTKVAYFSQHLVGDISDYGEVRDTIHKNIKKSIAQLMTGQEVKVSDLLRLEGESSDDPLSLLQDSHLTKKLAMGDFVKEQEILSSVEAVKKRVDLNRDYMDDSFSP